MTDERRKDPRLPVRLEAEVRFTSWLVYSLLYAVNISKGGMNLEMTDEPQLGDVLEIKLTQPDGTALRFNAVVKHVTPNGGHFSVGVQFDSLDADTREGIERKLRAHGAANVSPGVTPRRT